MPTCNVQTTLAHRPNYWENSKPEAQYIGVNRFNQEQIYEGEFFRGSFHGQGTYKWTGMGVYEGCFYSNFKDGYASVSLPNNSHFEGLFIKNSPFGPGVLTYSNGRQDAGFWVGRKLVRLSRPVDFIIPRLAPSSAAKIKLLQFRRLIPLDEMDLEPDMKHHTDILRKYGYPFEHFYSPYCSLIYDPRSTFFDLLAFDKTYFKNTSDLIGEFTGSIKDWEMSMRQSETDDEEQKSQNLKGSPVPFLRSGGGSQRASIDCTCGRSLEGDHELGILGQLTRFGTLGKESEEELAVGEEGEGEEMAASKILSWNRSELCTEFLKQIFRYRAYEDVLNFNLGKLMIGARTAFRRTGVKESECLKFLKMCSMGPANVIKDLICSFDVSPELMDARGNNSLMFAAAADLHDVMDVLLDFGVDVNAFNDEHLTPLNLCLLRRLAQAFGLCNWEAAFLPKEIEGEQMDFLQPWQSEGSISSLDRIIGDGMSLEDTRSNIHSLPSVLWPMCREIFERGTTSRASHSDETVDFSFWRRITALNIIRSVESQTCVPTCHRPLGGGTKRSHSMSEMRQVAEPQVQRVSYGSEGVSRNSKILPFTIKRDEFQKSVAQCTNDRYFFEYRFGKNPSGRQTEKTQSPVAKPRKEKGEKDGEAGEAEEAEEEAAEPPKNCQTMKKICEIDKTIEKLLRRGADPNISEVPKPSIHLGMFTGDLEVVYALLSHGANPNSRLYSNEGLLTPLHVLVLQKSAPENLGICSMLLNFGADAALETSPEFLLSEEEEACLDPATGRTPLELLCMRPDLEVADPNGDLIQMGLLLAERTKRRFYNGHSWLTLAMLSGNLKLLKALLEYKMSDPNEILGKDRGTALHVLVSTELQLKTNFSTSAEMCDLLLEAGSDPLIKFTRPESLVGTCVDYGYREIEKAKQAKQEAAEEDKKGGKNGKEKTSLDYLVDHKKVVEYLGKKASEKRKGSKEESKKGGKKGKDLKRGKKNGNGGDGDISEGGKKGKEDDGKVEKAGDDSKGKTERKDKDVSTEKKVKDVSKEKKDKDAAIEKKDKDVSTEKKDKDVSKKKKDKDVSIEKKDKDGDASKKKEEDGVSKKEKDNALERKTEKGGVTKGKKDEDGNSRNKKDKDETEKKGKTPETKDDGGKGRKTPEVKDKRKEGEGAAGEQEGNSEEKPETCGQMFPEKLRQELLYKYGTSANIDINEFLVPYVVLRDGQLYYRFKGEKTSHKEQYSLI